MATQPGNSILSAAQNASTGDPKEPPTPEVTNQHRNDWNQYQAYLNKKGLAGNTQLDKGDGDNNEGVKALEQYRKDNPTTSLSKEMVAPYKKISKSIGNGYWIM